jgi:hypothetical protein
MVILFLLTCTFTAMSDSSLDSGLTAQYNFDGNVNDLSVNAYHGLAIGNPTYSRDRFNRPNSSLYLNGVTQYIGLPTSIPSNTIMFISFWIKTSQSNPNNWDSAIYLIDRNNCATDRDWNISIGLGGKIIFVTGIFEPLGGGVSKLVSSVSINDNKWHHIGIAYNYYSEIYIDGIMRARGDAYVVTFLTENVPVLIGESCCHLNARQKFQGTIDDLRIYNRIMSEQEIKMLYRGETSYIRFIPQGLYNLQTKMLNRSDSVVIFVREMSMPWGYEEWNIIDTLHSRIDSVTFMAPFQKKFSWGAVSLEVRHKGSISTWSVIDYQSATPFISDFTAHDISVGANQVIVDSEPMFYAAYSGDLNYDGIIDATDQLIVENAIFASKDQNSDLNGDHAVDIKDLEIVTQNALNLIEMKYYKNAPIIKYLW